MAAPGSEAAHSEKIAQLVGDGAREVLAAPASYPPLSRGDLIATALEAGKTCRIKTAPARLLVFKQGDAYRAIATVLRHGGYRRDYVTHEAAALDDLLAELVAAYDS